MYQYADQGHQDDHQKAGDERPCKLQISGYDRTFQFALREDGIQHVGVNFDPGDRVVHGARSNIQEPGGAGADEDELALDARRVHRAVKDVFGRNVEAWVVFAVVNIDATLGIGRELVAADDHAVDAERVRLDGVRLVAGRHTQHLDDQRGVEVLTHPHHGGHAPHHAVALGLQGHHATAGRRLLEQGDVADNRGVNEDIVLRIDTALRPLFADRGSLG